MEILVISKNLKKLYLNIFILIQNNLISDMMKMTDNWMKLVINAIISNNINLKLKTQYLKT